MASVRTKLTATYAVALVATIVVFGAALMVAKTATTEHVVRRLATERAEMVVRVLREAADDADPLVTTDDSLVPKLRTQVGSRLTPLRDYLLVLAADGRVLFNSDAAAGLSAIDSSGIRGLDDDQIYQRQLEAWRTYDNFVRLGRSLSEPRLDTIVRVGGDDALVVARLLRDPSIPVERVVVGIPVGWLASQARRELFGTMVVIAPVLIVLSVGAAFLLAGHTLIPLERLMTQLEAITDGRSLHRRLPVDDSGDEIARLSATLNAMLGRLENYFGALRRFTADASHELKTPLTVLRADVERAMNATTTPAERLVALEEALQETTRMADLVEQLLTLARADEGRFDLHREPVALGPVVRDVLETALILGEEGGIAVRTPVLEDVTVMGDGARLRQLFLNLVTNAIKYTPRGGEVEIALRKAGDVVTFSVRDTGIGIAAADLPYIFDRFWRADRVRSRSGARGGFGLGLAISQWIAQAHGGSLTATSRLGRGSVFTVTLPFAPDGSTAEYPIPQLAQLAHLAGEGAAD